jgi:tetratricopeptide (TPR) repeat protein
MKAGWVLALLFAGAPARAATGPSVQAVTGKVQVGHDSQWKDAAAGTPVGAADFVRVDPGATVTILLADGKTASFTGRAIVPGRRLVPGATSAGASVWLAQALQRASDAVVGKDARGEVAGGAKPAGKDFGYGNEDKTLALQDAQKVPPDLGSAKNSGGGSGAVENQSQGASATNGNTKTLDAMSRDSNSGNVNDVHTESAPVKIPARESSVTIDDAESKLASGELEVAQSLAKTILDAKPDAMTAGRAHLVLGAAAADLAELQTADTELGLAAKTLTGDWLAAAHARRGIVLQELGQDDRARTELRAAIDAAPKSAPAAQAWFYLGADALASGRKRAARKDFRNLAAYPALSAQAEELMKQAR